MKNYIIKLLGGYTADELSDIIMYIDNSKSCLCYDIDKIKILGNAEKGILKLCALCDIYKNFFLDAIQGKNRDEHGKFCTRNTMEDYFAWCKIYGQMPHKKLTNEFMRYERSLSKVKSVKLTGEAQNV